MEVGKREAGRNLKSLPPRILQSSKSCGPKNTAPFSIQIMCKIKAGIERREKGDGSALVLTATPETAQGPSTSATMTGIIQSQNADTELLI